MVKQKKILMIAFDFPPQIGGVATYSEEMALSFHNLGFQVLVITKKRESKKSFPFKTESIVLPSSGILSLPLLTFQIRKTIQEFQPDFIFNSLWLPDATATYLALKSLNSKIPYVLTVHGMEILPHSWKGKLRSQLIFFKNKVFRNSQACICISEFTKNLVISENLCSADKTHVIPNGVNPEKFNVIDPEKTNKSFPLLLTVARLMPHKGIDSALKSLPEVIKIFPNLCYKIVGTGPDRMRLEKLVSDLNLQNHVQLLGAVDNSELPRLYAQADLFILLSRQIGQHVEGFGLVILEAALAKTPCLGGQSGGIPDAIIDGVTGWLVDPENIDSISQQLIEILQNPEELKKVSQKAYDHTLQERTWNHASKKLIQVLSGAL